MAKTEWLKKTLPQGFKKEFLGPEQQSHRISRGRDFLKVEFLRYWSNFIFNFRQARGECQVEKKAFLEKLE